MADITISVPSPTPKVIAYTAISNNPGQGFTSPFTTDWHQFTNTDVVIALSGSATAVVAVVERSCVNPFARVAGSLVPQGPITTPADSDGFSGNLSAGIPANIYTESGVGWWRVRVSSVTGGDCTASLSGLGVPS